MKKFIMLSAVMAAVSTAFVACSSDDDLAQAPAVPEENVSEVSEGTPLTIKVVDATRGTDWTATTLPSFALFTTEHTGTTAWLSGEEFTNDGYGVFTHKIVPPATESVPVSWETGAWDFYAVSDVSANMNTDNMTASDRSFTYTVTNDYANQHDLIVASTLNQDKDDTGSSVTLDLYHALARIKSVKLNYHASLNNAGTFLVIKSMTLKNIPSTGTFTFPDDNLQIDRSDEDPANHIDNVSSAWGSQTNLLNYTFTFPDFERDDDGNVLIFDETRDSGGDLYENEYKKFHENTKRGGLADFPNYLAIPSGTNSASWEFPLEINVDNTTTPATNTRANNKGLFLLPQTLAKTVAVEDTENEGLYYYNSHGENSPYLEILYYGINAPYINLTDFYTANQIDPSSVSSLADESNTEDGGNGLSLAIGNHTLVTNARINYALENEQYLSTAIIPLSQIILKGGQYYTLNAYLNLATDELGYRIFLGSKVE